jgi:hypothetical protein
MCFKLIFLWFFLFCKKDYAFYAGEFVWNCRFGPIENGGRLASYHQHLQVEPGNNVYNWFLFSK